MDVVGLGVSDDICKKDSSNLSPAASSYAATAADPMPRLPRYAEAIGNTKKGDGRNCH